MDWGLAVERKSDLVTHAFERLSRNGKGNGAGLDVKDHVDVHGRPLGRKASVSDV